MDDPMAAIAGQSAGPAAPPLDAPELRAWRAFLLAQAAVLRALADDLDAEAGLPLAEYDALVNLAIAPGRRLRMSELADRLVISRSGVTRLVDRLEEQALVARSTCTPDGRGAYAVLTPAGLARVRVAVPIHLRHVTARFLDVIDPADLPAVERAMTAVAQATGRCTAFVGDGRPDWLHDDPSHVEPHP